MRIYLIIILAVLFIQCSGDDQYKIDTVDINDKTYVLPKVSGDADEIVNYLNHICSDVAVKNNGNKTYIIAKLTKDESELFKEFKYEIETYNGFFQGVNLTYVYRNLYDTTVSVRKQIVEYIEKNTKVEF